MSTEPVCPTGSPTRRRSEADPPIADPDDVLTEVLALRERVATAPVGRDRSAVHERHRAGARNLDHYVALRSSDLRGLQERLSRLGASSLGRCEAHVLATVDAVAGLVGRACGVDVPPIELGPAPDAVHGQRHIDANATALLGPPSARRATRIMVTLPTEAATDAELVETMVAAGMEVARINCAHDGPDAWRAMAAHVERAAALHDRTVRILMDLAGPKLRTGPIAPPPGVVKLRPQRDTLGRVLAPAQARFVVSEADATSPVTGPDAVPVEGLDTRRLEVGMTGRLVDARGAHRRVTVAALEPGAVVVATDRTIYLTNGTRVDVAGHRLVVVGLPPGRGAVELTAGDPLDLVADLTPVEPHAHPVARIGCTLPQVFAVLEPGHRMSFDDGRFRAVVEEVHPGRARLRITAAPPPGRSGRSKLRAEKGINFPDTDIPIPALTDADREHLAIVAELADIVALSFVRRPADVTELHDALDEMAVEREHPPGVVLKIETITAFERLPEILLAGMARPELGVMIARGDLAVEAGYRELAEVQEEILWLCEAAHVPVIWATEVLDCLARSGRPSRSEITDAAWAARAECVMLNKGPFIAEAIRTLDEILDVMSAHQAKKRPLLPRLAAWTRE